MMVKTERCKFDNNIQPRARDDTNSRRTCSKKKPVDVINPVKKLPEVDVK